MCSDNVRGNCICSYYVSRCKPLLHKHSCNKCRRRIWPQVVFCMWCKCDPAKQVESASKIYSSDQNKNNFYKVVSPERKWRVTDESRAWAWTKVPTPPPPPRFLLPLSLWQKKGEEFGGIAEERNGRFRIRKSWLYQYFFVNVIVP